MTTTVGNARMRVLHVSQPVEAGVANVVTALVSDQCERGYDVHVACPPGPGLAAKVRLLGARDHAWAAVRPPGVTVLSEGRRLRRIVERVNPDVVVLHSAKAGMAGRLALRNRWPTVFVPHAWSFEAVRGPLMVASSVWEVLAGRWTDVVVCVSEDERSRGRKAGVACAMEVIANGVDIQARVPHPAAPARRLLGLADRPTVVCVGRLATQKGQDLLLASWPSVVSAVPDAQLLLIGDGPKRAALEATAPPGVVFFGTRDDTENFFAAADVVVLPSRWESTPIVSLEAMAAGRPVVTFAVDGVRATLGDTGVVLEPGDVKGMGEAIVALLTDRPGAVAAGHAAREQVAAVGDLRTVLKTWNDLLAELVGRGRRPPAALRMAAVTTVFRFLVSGALRTADVAVVPGNGWAQGLRTSLLSALGVPVWWQGAGGRPALPTLGAPTICGPAGIEQLARAARRPGAGAVDGPAVSVVVTVLNEGLEVGRLVADLLPQIGPADEIVIVDGGSSDGSIAALPSHRSLLVEIRPGAGISAGRNHGVRLARNDVIICTDAGCVPESGFVDGFRRAFAVADPPPLVSGVYRVNSRNAMELAQALACYPQPAEVRRPSLLVLAYARLFGTGFDPRFAVGRCVAFTRSAWALAGGFPEHLATGEDVSFGLAVAREGECLATTAAVVGWNQRDGLGATWRMYRGYGRASTGGGDRKLLIRDSARAAAYLAAPALLSGRHGRRLVAAGAGAYLSLPVVRALSARAGLAAVALLPVALAVKDLGKVTGALQELVARTPRKRHTK